MCSKVTKPDFPGKSLFEQVGAERAQNGPKIDFFNCFSELSNFFFLFFLHEVKGP